MPSFLQALITSLILAVIGWGGLAATVFFTVPTLGPRWLFFFFLTVAITGTIFPLVVFLNRRFVSNPPAGSSVLVRESLMTGIYGSVLTWLQLGRELNISVAMLVAGGMIAIEVLLRLGEQSRWRPRNSDEDL